MSSDQARLIAERIAQRVSQQPVASGEKPSRRSDLSAELSAMRATLEQLQHKLVQIEAKVTRDSDAGYSQHSATTPRVPLTHSPWLVGVNATPMHPSQERFGVEEATVSELVDFFQNEKTCSVEPGSKPCDHCSMCSTRGF